MNAGITGVTGGFGRRLVELLLEKKINVKALIRQGSRIEELKRLPVSFVCGDITRPETLVDFIKDIDVCFHLAAQVTFAAKHTYYAVNVEGTKNICKAILNNNPDCHLLYCSTISTLRVLPCFKIRSSVYALSKYKAEKVVLDYIEKDKLKATIIYPGLIFGKYDKNFIPKVVHALKSRKLKLFKGGEANAPCIFVDDLCELFIKCALNSISAGKRYISVTGLDIGIHDFIKIIADKLHLPFPEKVYPKQIFFLLAVLFEFVYTLLGKKGKPPIYRTLVNNLSNNMKNYKKKYDDSYVDLGWKQDTSKEAVVRQLDAVLGQG